MTNCYNHYIIKQLIIIAFMTLGFVNLLFAQGKQTEQIQDSIATHNANFTKKAEADELYNSGVISFEKQEYNAAIIHFGKAIEIYPEHTNAFLNRGTAYLKLKDYEKSIADFNQAINYNPNFVSAYYNRGKAHYLSTNYDLAYPDFEKTIWSWIVIFEIPNKYAWEVRNLEYEPQTPKTFEMAP